MIQNLFESLLGLIFLGLFQGAIGLAIIYPLVKGFELWERLKR